MEELKNDSEEYNQLKKQTQSKMKALEEKDGFNKSLGMLSDY